MENFDKDIIIGFLDEADQLLSNAESLFLNLEQASRRADGSEIGIVEELFRLAHSLKGGASMVGLEEFSKFTHQLESLLSKAKTKKIAIDSTLVSLLLRGHDQLHFMLNAYRGNPATKVDNSAILAQIAAVLAVPDSATAPAATVSAAVREDPAVGSSKDAVQNVRISIERLDRMINLAGELANIEASLSHEMSGNPLPKAFRSLEKVTKEIQNTAMSLRMLPLRQVFRQLQRSVRDTATRLGKEVVLTTTGEETEVDRAILNHLVDPLVHLVRNAVDHGVESGEERTKLGKNKTGTIHLSAYQEGSEIALEIRDDGHGLDPKILIAKAREKGLLRGEQPVTDAAAYQLIFMPGFSTKTEVTEISGRGVGMDVVKSNITQLQGRVEIESQIGKGTCFRIHVPLTLAVIDAMIVRVGNDRYVLPLSKVNESLQPKMADVTRSRESAEHLLCRGEILPIYRLGELLGKTSPRAAASQSTAIVVRSHTDKPFSVLVDDIISTQSVVIKPLDTEIGQLPWIIGGAILTDGTPSLILDLQQIVEAAA